MQSATPSASYTARLPRVHRLFNELSTARTVDAKRHAMMNLEELAKALAHDEARKGRRMPAPSAAAVHKHFLDAVLHIEEAELRFKDVPLESTVNRVQAAMDNLMRALELLRGAATSEDKR